MLCFWLLKLKQFIKHDSTKKQKKHKKQFKISKWESKLHSHSHKIHIKTGIWPPPKGTGLNIIICNFDEINKNPLA